VRFLSSDYKPSGPQKSDPRKLSLRIRLGRCDLKSLQLENRFLCRCLVAWHPSDKLNLPHTKTKSPCSENLPRNRTSHLPKKGQLNIKRRKHQKRPIFADIGCRRSKYWIPNRVCLPILSNLEICLDFKLSTSTNSYLSTSRLLFKNRYSTSAPDKEALRNLEHEHEVPFPMSSRKFDDYSALDLL
jgi:hypothetical protein